MKASLFNVLSALWQILSAILCWLLSVTIFCLSKLKDLLEPNENKVPQPEYATKQDLVTWLDEYFKEKFAEKPVTKTEVSDNSTLDDNEPEKSVPDKKAETETLPQTSHYAFPSLDLLKDYPQENSENIAEEVESKKQLIKQTLGDFGISVIDISATVGSTVTLYELTLARGVSANKIKTIDEDIARNLKVQAVRIISPFRDRGTVALEVPNSKSQIVGLKSILGTDEFQNCGYELPLALGKTIDSTPKIIDLAEMFHILIGGATGQGKSVCLNAMLSSLLYTKTPAELKLLLIDPKVNEFSIYKNLGKRFTALNIEKTVFTNDLEEIAVALQTLCEEMKQRQMLFDKANCRNIQEYNANKKSGSADYLPRIVVVIDEFVDILKHKSIETSILELVRKSRAQGIHLIVATQRPSAKVISGDITANFPARIAFKVIKWQNSDIILGENGAEKLLGKGDMLLSVNSDIDRVQGAFVDTEEVKEITNYIKITRQ
jgi:S-DNA-T family DNA segregation ATPase FtsK/SpoIIIE